MNLIHEVFQSRSQTPLSDVKNLQRQRPVEQPKILQTKAPYLSHNGSQLVTPKDKQIIQDMIAKASKPSIVR